MKNYYEILEVNQKASKEVIDKAYKVLVKKYHPDGKDIDKKHVYEEKIKEINEAYDVLSDSFLREQYDLEIEKENSIKYEESRVKQQEKVKDEIQDKNNEETENRSGGLTYFIDFFIELFQNKSKREHIKEVTKKDALAVGLTIVVIVILGVILWCIPFTNQWMRELLFENPVFNAIGALFSK